MELVISLKQNKNGKVFKKMTIKKNREITRKKSDKYSILTAAVFV